MVKDGDLSRMTVTITSYLNEDTDYIFVEEKKSWIMGYDTNISHLKDPIEGNLSFYSDEPKLFLKIPYKHYHVLQDFLATVLHMYEINPNIVFIVDTYEIDRSRESTKFHRFCFNILDYYGIKYHKADFSNVKSFNANNFYAIGVRNVDHNGANLILKYCMPWIKNKDIEPFRKVYISRRLVKSDNSVEFRYTDKTKLTRSSIKRIDDEEKLEDFFRSQGFEVVVPEDFESFEDQINFFYEVKSAISLTGAGLVNTVFMQNGGSVIELQTSLIVRFFDRSTNKQDFQEGVHHFYHTIAFKKNFFYVCVNNMDINSDKLIEQFKNNKSLIAFMEQ